MEGHFARLDPPTGQGLHFAMPPRRTSKKDSPAKLPPASSAAGASCCCGTRAKSSVRSEAADVASAKAAAAIQFGLDEIQRNRIMVQELA